MSQPGLHQTQEFICQSDANTLHYLRFGLGSTDSGIPVKKGTGKGNYKRFVWKVDELMSLDSYMDRLSGQLTLDIERQTLIRRLTLGFKLSVAVAAVFPPTRPFALGLQSVTGGAQIAWDGIDAARKKKLGSFVKKELLKKMVELGVKQLVPMISPEYALTANKGFKKFTDDALDVLDAAQEAGDVGKVNDIVAEFFTQAVSITAGPSCTDLLLVGAARKYYDCFSLRMAFDPVFAETVKKAAIENDRNVRLQSATTGGTTPMSAPNAPSFDLKILSPSVTPVNSSPYGVPSLQK